MAIVRRTITADKEVVDVPLTAAARGEVSYNTDTKVATVTLTGVSQDTALRGAKIIARHTRKDPS